MFVQQAREMVLEIIREKDQADFRGVRGDFSSRMGGGSIEVCASRAGGEFQVAGPGAFSCLTLSMLLNSRLRCKAHEDAGPQGGCEEGAGRYAAEGGTGCVRFGTGGVPCLGEASRLTPAPRVSGRSGL